MFIILLGLPGCGKGTQSRLLAAKFSFDIIAVGELIRKAVQADQVTLQVKNKMAKGEILDDRFIFDLISDTLRSLSQEDDITVVFDGFPRTASQVVGFYDIMRKQSDYKFVVLEYLVEESDLINRLSSRIICSRCGTPTFSNDNNLPCICASCGSDKFYTRSDDELSIVRARIAGHISMIQDMKIEWSKLGLREGRNHFCIDGKGTVEEVFNRTQTMLNLFFDTL